MLNPLKALFDLVYPDLCVSCNHESRIHNHLFCIRCLASLPYRNLSRNKQEAFEQHFYSKYHLIYALAFFHLNPGSSVAKLIHQLKYHENPYIGVQLGAFMGDVLLSYRDRYDFDVIVPVPLHKKKERQRGYNQSEQIAKGISTKLGVSVDRSLIQRNRFTITQTSLNRMERLTNIRDAFSMVEHKTVDYNHVLLVDDVLTTGSTLSACADVLIGAGATSLSMMTLALGD